MLYISTCLTYNSTSFRLIGTPVLDVITQSAWLLTRFPIPDSRFPAPFT
ncbi:MAG: hypothetical protein F6K65_22725 [Moorea sp. SIO3C2]|nr:hypothetical protein [Moorena sp. SIO3C2]